MTNSPLQKTMTLENARKVYWIRPNYKPLGELLDQGYLDRDRLEWAAAKAYNTELRQAAQVILEWQRQNSGNNTVPKSNQPAAEPISGALPLPISLAQARATIWPMANHKGQPMGTLVETRQISLKDLGFAIENAFDPRVRQAAIVLMSIRLQQTVEEPAPSVGGLHVFTAGRSFALIKQFQYMILIGVLIGVIGAISSLVLIQGVGNMLKVADPNSETHELLTQTLAKPYAGVSLLIAIVILLFGGFLVNRVLSLIFNVLFDRFDRHRKGEDGEQRVTELIQQVLDGHWYLFRNLHLPGENKADLDGVLVGPTGVWALEIKNLTGEYRNIADLWEYRIKGRWRKSRYNPSKQAENNARRLASFLRADGVSQWINGAVIWANTEDRLTVENPQVAVWSPDRLADELGNLWQKPAIPEEKRQQIVDKLTKLCEAQIKARYEDRV